MTEVPLSYFAFEKTLDNASVLLGDTSFLSDYGEKSLPLVLGYADTLSVDAKTAAKASIFQELKSLVFYYNVCEDIATVSKHYSRN